MKREIIRVEPLSTYLERWKAPTSAVTRTGNTAYLDKMDALYQWTRDQGATSTTVQTEPEPVLEFPSFEPEPALTFDSPAIDEELTFEPPWSPELISPAGKEKLGME